MIVIIILLTSLHCAQPTCVAYEQGWSQQFFSDCKDGHQYQPTISFQNEFCGTPQILIQTVFYSNEKISCHMREQIKQALALKYQQQQQKFQVQVQCDSPFYLEYYLFNWVALIDNQLLVVNDFMSSITLIDGYRTALIPYPMQNTDYEISYSITSYSGGSPNIVVEKQATGFNLYITGVSGTQLSGLGVQIIAGLKSMYTLFDIMSITCPIRYDFQPITLLPTQFRIKVQQSIHDLVRATDYYSSLPWFDCRVFYFDDVCHYDLPVIYKLYIYDFKYQPHFYKKIRAAHMMCMDHLIMLSFITQKLYFKEIDKTWSDIDTLSIPMMQYNDASISLVYSHACQPNRKITITILKQVNSNYIYTQYCHRLYNLITMYIHLFSYRSTTSELQFSLQLKKQFIIKIQKQQQLLKGCKFKRKCLILVIQSKNLCYLINLSKKTVHISC